MAEEKKIKTIKDIIEHHLISNGYDGLRSDSGECGCLMDDLAPCDAIYFDCVPAYKHECSKCEDSCIDKDDRIRFQYCLKTEKQELQIKDNINILSKMIEHAFNIEGI